LSFTAQDIFLLLYVLDGAFALVLFIVAFLLSERFRKESNNTATPNTTKSTNIAYNMYVPVFGLKEAIKRGISKRNPPKQSMDETVARTPTGPFSSKMFAAVKDMIRHENIQRPLRNERLAIRIS